MKTRHVLRLIVAMTLLFAFALVEGKFTGDATESAQSVNDTLGHAVKQTPVGLTGATTALGILLLGAWCAGQICSTLRVPRVTGYLLLGLLVGPSALGLVTHQESEHLHFVNALATSLIALIAGGEIQLRALRKTARQIVSITGVQMLVIILGIIAAIFFAPDFFLSGSAVTGTEVFIVAIMLATLATASSPAVTIALITELKATGPMSQCALAVTVAKDLTLIVLFAIVLAIAGRALPAPAQGSTDMPTPAATTTVDHTPAEADSIHAAEQERPLVVELLVRLGGSLVAGLAIGLLLAWYVRVVTAHLPIVIVLVCFAVALFGEAFGMEPLIVALVSGILMRNAWPEDSEQLFHTLEELSLPVYCVFFAVAGAKIDLDKLQLIWPAALTLVVIRGALVWFGVHLGARIVRAPVMVRTWVWTAMIPQAGVTLALIAIIERTFSHLSFAEPFYVLVITMIAMEQFIGPFLLKLGLTRAGEVGSEDQFAEAA